MINRKSVSIRVWFRVLTAMLCLSVVGEALEAQSSSEDSSVYYEKALIRFADGDYDGAAIQLKNALQIDPDDLVARLLLGRTYLRLSDGASAEVQIRHARQGGADEELVLVPLAKSYFIQGKYQQIVDEIASTDDTLEVKAEIHVLRGLAFIELGELDRAEGEFAYATMLRPEYADALMGQGRVLLRRGHFEQGEALVERANAMEPDNGDTWHFKAEISRQRGDLNLALTYFDRAIELQEFHMPARVGRAALLIGLDRDEEALEDIMFVRERLPTDAQAAYLYGFVLTRRGDTQEAQAVLSEAVNALKQLPPDFLNEHSPSLYLFGLIAYAQGQYDDAYRHLVRFLEFAPSHVKARKLVGSLEIKFGESLTAIDTLESAVVLAPNDPQAHELLGEAYRQRGRYEEAARMFEKASELAPDDVDVKAKVIVSHLTMGRRQEAISELESALQQEPDNVQALLLLARLQLNAKQYDAALRTVLRTSKLAPDTAQSYNIAGAAQFGKGNFRSARAAFEHAIEIRPDFVPAKLNLANLTRKQGRVQEAKESYLKILKDHDNNVRALESLAELAELEDRITDAISWREKIRAAHPKSVREVLPLIGIYLKREQPKAAWVVSQDLVTRQPTNPTVLLAAAQVEVALDKPDRARTTLQSATRYAGYNSRELYVIAKQQEHLDDLEGAHWSLMKALKGDPTFLPVVEALVALEIATGRMEQALAHAAALRDAAPDESLGHTLVGDVLIAQGRFQEGIAEYQRALAVEDDPAVVVRLYQSKLEVEPVAQALDALRAWKERHPEDFIVRRHLASAYIEAGQLDEALDEHESLLEHFPNDAGIVNNLAWLYRETGDSRAMSYAEHAYELAPQAPSVLDTLGWALVDRGEYELAVCRTLGRRTK